MEAVTQEETALRVEPEPEPPRLLPATGAVAEDEEGVVAAVVEDQTQVLWDPHQDQIRMTEDHGVPLVLHVDHLVHHHLVLVQ